MAKQKRSIIEEFMFGEEWLNSGKLEAMHTRQLLAIKNSTFIYHIYHIYHNGNNHITNYKSLYDKVKVILATREHIPSKKEAKQIRQAKAKQGH